MATPPYSDTNPRARYVRSAIATTILLAMLAVFISAGVWQLDRAGQKYDLQAAFAAGSIVIVLKEPIDEAEIAEYRFRLVELSGHYDPSHQVLLDSIVMQGRNGYQIITPFITGEQTVLINRGWVPADVDRSILPDIEIDSKPRMIKARINTLPAPGIRLDAPPATAADWPLRMLYPTRDQIVAALGKPVPNYQLLLNADQADGYMRDWQAVGVGPQKHYGYAFQWFSFAILALVFYVILNVRWNNQHKKTLAVIDPNE
jgi:surfeit locus 1 family protein